MHRRPLFIFTLFLSCSCIAQHDFLLLKKKHKTIRRFPIGATIVLQLKNGNWIGGDINRIGNDSFFVNRRSVHYSMEGIDTLHFGIIGIAISDVAYMPRPTAIINYRNDQPVVTYGHEKFVYIKNGLLLKLAGGGYAALNITNTLLDGDPVFGKRNRKRLLIAGALFAAGEILHQSYHRFLSLRKKYHLEIISVSATGLPS